MRTKSRGGGKPKPSRRSPTPTAASTPSSTVSPSVADRDAPNAEDNTLIEASTKETRDVSDEVDCFRKDTCIRCDESGGLLVCTEIGCPIALHEYCMSCDPTFDEEGRFYCPYCSYKKALVQMNELRRKAMVAKKALSDFIDTGMVNGDNSLQIGESNKTKASNVSTCGADANLVDRGSHLDSESLGDRAMQVERNQSNEEEDHEITAGDAQLTVGVNAKNHGNPIVSNVSNNIHSTPEVQPVEDPMNEEETRHDNPIVSEVNNNIHSTSEVQPLEDPMNEEETRHDDPIVYRVSNNIHSTPEVQPLEDSMNVDENREADAPGTHQVGSLEDKDDGKMMEEETLRSTDDIQNEGTVKDQGQPETSSAHNDEEETAVDVVDHGVEREPQDNGDGGERIQPDKEGMLENINAGSGNDDLKNETIVKKKRFKTKANRRIDLQNFSSSRKSARIRTPEPGKKSPHIKSPEPGKNHLTKIEKVCVSRKLKLQSVSPNQFKKLDSHGGKRKRLFWSTEEEEMLKEGVQKFSSTANKNLPWRKILEFGRHVFDDTRTPVDLKDKWRNIIAK